VETGHGEILGHRQPKGPANKQGFTYPTAPLLDSTLFGSPFSGPKLEV
jgi:hypothetical protein